MRNCCSSLLLWWLQLTLLNQRKYIYIANGYYQFLVEKKSRKNHFLPTFVLLLTKIDYFLWNVLQWYLSVKQQKKVRKKNQRDFCDFSFVIWNLVKIGTAGIETTAFNGKTQKWHLSAQCDNYVSQWWIELDDELSWLFINGLSSTTFIKVKRMGITEILRRIWLFSAN